MHRLPLLAGSAASAAAGFLICRKIERSQSPQEMSPCALFVAAKSLEALSVQQSIYRLGDPNVSLTSPVIFRDNYVLSFDERMRNPKWVFEKITKSDLDGEADRKDCGFQQDTEVHEYFRSQNLDYRASGFDRGHMACAANHKKSPTVLQETFLLSNICPQHPGLNRKLWKRLEIYTRSLAKHNDAVYVCTGPLYLPKERDNKLFVEYQLLGSQHVAVPTHFFKILLLESQDGIQIKSYVMENGETDGDDDLNNYLTPLDAIERASGLIFFNNLFKEKFGKQVTKINDLPIKRGHFW